MGGLPESAPARSAEPLPFPNVYEVRPTREAKPLNDDEQKKLETELTTLRDHQKTLATPPAPPPAKKAAAPAPKAAAKATPSEEKAERGRGTRAERPGRRAQDDQLTPRVRPNP